MVRIGAPAHFPIQEHRYPGLKTAPQYDIRSWQEALVLVTAHELRHQQQFRSGWRMGEVDAERWALERLLEYRALGENPQLALPLGQLRIVQGPIEIGRPAERGS